MNTPFLGIDHLRFGLIGAPICLVVMVVVSLMTKEPDAATQKMVDDTRIPTGKAILGKTTLVNKLKIKRGANFSPLFFD